MEYHFKCPAIRRNIKGRPFWSRVWVLASTPTGKERPDCLVRFRWLRLASTPEGADRSAEMIATRGFARTTHSSRVRQSHFPTNDEALRVGRPQVRLDGESATRAAAGWRRRSICAKAIQSRQVCARGIAAGLKSFSEIAAAPTIQKLGLYRPYGILCTCSPIASHRINRRMGSGVMPSR
jgi:hypothetical protein